MGADWYSCLSLAALGFYVTTSQWLEIEEQVRANLSALSFVTLREEETLLVFVYLKSTEMQTYIEMVGPYEITRENKNTSIETSDSIAQLLMAASGPTVLDEIASLVGQQISFFLIHTTDIFAKEQTPSAVCRDYDIDDESVLV